MAKRSTKYIFVVGGIMSGIGKGISCSSIATILSHYGYRVNVMKVDPYLNEDAGTMNPVEHGEVFVLDSGLETDQDMGNYERFLNRDLSSDDYLTSGVVYRSVIDRERSFGYAGRCVEAIPDVVGEIRDRIERSASRSGAEVQVVEIGGTLGDYQNSLFLETARQMRIGNDGDVAFALVGYLPCPKNIGEPKTRPTQHAIQTLNTYGINPSIIIARSDVPIDRKRKEKIARACNISERNIISAPDVKSIYDVPMNFDKDGIGQIIMKELRLAKRKETGVLDQWKDFSRRLHRKKARSVRIGIVGKYFETGDHMLGDVYLSVIEAVRFSCARCSVGSDITWLSAKQFEGGKRTLKELDSFDGLVIPGGFGSSGVEGKLAVIRHARERGIPLLGICYGMQLMVVEFARNVLRKKRAHTLEVDPDTPDDVITLIEDQRKKLAESRYGGSMRLGVYAARIGADTLLSSLYDSSHLRERHRHRYEVNDAYASDFEEHGLILSARSSAGLVEAVELPTAVHPFFVGVQFHPEFTARPFSPNPLFTGLITAAKKRSLSHSRK